MASQNLYKFIEERLESRLHCAQTRIPCSPVLFWIIGLCLGALIVCGAALVYGHTLPSLNATSRLGLARCSAKPCFRGMTPGATSWLEVKTAFRSEPAVALYPFEGKVALFPSLDGHSLGLVLITPSSDHPISAGEIIALYGQPDCVEISLATGFLVLHYTLLDVTLSVLREHFNTGTPVASIVLWDPASSHDNQSYLCNPKRSDVLSLEQRSMVRTWHGFASVQRYLASQ